jgi:hypothetical protein
MIPRRANHTSFIIAAALVLAVSISVTAHAGAETGGKTSPVPPLMEESAALLNSVGATVEAGYDTRYYFRGLWFADNTAWTGLSLNVPLTEKLTWNFGALYLSTVDTEVDIAVLGVGLIPSQLAFSELDLSTALTYDAGFVKVGLVYTHYEFFNSYSGTLYNAFGSFTSAGELNVSAADEIGVTVAVPIGPVNVYAGYFHDLRIGGSYLEAGADYPIEVTSWLSLVPAVKAGYGFDYYTGNDNTVLPGLPLMPGNPRSGFTHLGLSLSAPIRLTRTATVTPYIAYNVSGRARRVFNIQDNEMYAGIKIGVVF